MLKCQLHFIIINIKSFNPCLMSLSTFVTVATIQLSPLATWIIVSKKQSDSYQIVLYFIFYLHKWWYRLHNTSIIAILFEIDRQIFRLPLFNVLCGIAKTVICEISKQINNFLFIKPVQDYPLFWPLLTLSLGAHLASTTKS